MRGAAIGDSQRWHSPLGQGGVGGRGARQGALKRARAPHAAHAHARHTRCTPRAARTHTPRSRTAVRGCAQAQEGSRRTLGSVALLLALGASSLLAAAESSSTVSHSTAQSSSHSLASCGARRARLC